MGEKWPRPADNSQIRAVAASEPGHCVTVPDGESDALAVVHIIAPEPKMKGLTDPSWERIT
jgi:hypothetical protein